MSSSDGTIDVLCSEEMLTLVQPLERSAPLNDHGYLVARFDEATLREVPEETVDATPDAFWRECGRLNVTVEWDDDEIADRGFLNWLCDVHGISSERNVAAAIGDLAYQEGMTPVEFANKVAALGAVA